MRSPCDTGSISWHPANIVYNILPLAAITTISECLWPVLIHNFVCLCCLQSERSEDDANQMLGMWDMKLASFGKTTGY